MQKAIIYGSGDTGRRVYELCREKYEVIAFTDSNAVKWNTHLELDGAVFPILPPSEINSSDYDKLLLGSLLMDGQFINRLTKEFLVPPTKIVDEYIGRGHIGFTKAARETFLRREAELLQNVEGSIAEGGVYTGEFAALINEVLPDRQFHLFDTFEGFDARDVATEQEQGYSKPNYTAGYFSNNGFTLDDLLAKMPHPEKITIHKGYFPDSAIGDKQLDSEKFAFVNLDFDLYNPILAGLEYFYPKMVNGGVILVHDYFGEVFKGSGQAVRDYCSQNNIPYTAVGDELSIVIVKR
ncbi:MAG: TylF/MycF family methyltransferase [Oscillospiraceae bacterium]|jgi:O-methyltransferase|nr:TylF/MycF family methyltransferase [Oscillospiraceae bacterium]